MTTAHVISQNRSPIFGLSLKESALAILSVTLLGGGLFALTEHGRAWGVSKRAITMALNDPSFVAAAVRAGYRTEIASPTNSEPYLLARCARTDGEGPVACDPFPATDGQYRVRVAR